MGPRYGFVGYVITPEGVRWDVFNTADYGVRIVRQDDGASWGIDAGAIEAFGTFYTPQGQRLG